MEFKIGKCPKCGRTQVKLMFSNNPLDVANDGTPLNTICFDCIKENLDYNNLEHADFFCRRYNLPFNPELWMMLAEEEKTDVFEKYTKTVLEDSTYSPNLSYASSTHDLWSKVNKEWEKKRSFAEIIGRLKPIKESYMDRGRLKWGEQYTFEELIKLDSIYSKTLKANRITNPLQKEAVKTLCKLQIEMDEAIRANDAKASRDFSSAWSTFAKQADLETMINETKTDDITTVAELYDYMEKKGFQFHYYDGFPKDEVDNAIKDIQDSNRRLILESTGLQQTLEDMIKQRQEAQEKKFTDEITKKESLQDLLDFQAEDAEVETENDSDALSADFTEESDTSDNSPVVVKPKEEHSNE